MWIFNHWQPSFLFSNLHFWVDFTGEKTKCSYWKSRKCFCTDGLQVWDFSPNADLCDISHSLSIFFLSFFLLQISWIVIYALTLFSDLLTQCLVEVWLPYDVVVGFSKKKSANFRMLPWTYWSRFLLSLTIRILTNKTLLFPLFLIKALLTRPI